jgi:hypothetical protein
MTSRYVFLFFLTILYQLMSNCSNFLTNKAHLQATSAAAADEDTRSTQMLRKRAKHHNEQGGLTMQAKVCFLFISFYSTNS